MIFFSLFFEIFNQNRSSEHELEKQWLGQILQGAVNIEQSRKISLKDMGIFTGKILKGTDPQRRELKRLANVDTVIDIYRANARLLPDGPGRDKVFYYDPTSKAES